MKRIELYWYHDGKHDIYIYRNKRSVKRYRANSKRIARISHVLFRSPIYHIVHSTIASIIYES